MLVGPSNEVWLSDFGIAIVEKTTRSQRPQDIAGTIAYMAPEQLDNHPCTASDQYALGVVVYEWLCGKCPFSGSFQAVANQHLSITPPSLRKEVPEIPPDVEQVVLRTLAKDPQQRFSSVKAFAEALEQAVISSPNPKVSRRKLFMLVGTGLAAGLVVGVFGDRTISPLFLSYKSTHVAGNPSHLATPAPLKLPYIFFGHFGEVNTVAWSPGGKLIASASADQTIQMWELKR